MLVDDRDVRERGRLGRVMAPHITGQLFDRHEVPQAAEIKSTALLLRLMTISRQLHCCQ